MLQGHVESMWAKARLLSLLELVRRKPAGERAVAFSEIAAATQLEVDQV